MNTKQHQVVFIVDDDEGIRQALVALMTTLGYEAQVFSRPSDFLRQLQRDQGGCLLLDVRMPEMSGIEVLQQLNRSGSMLPVIIISGHGDIPMAVQAMKDGAFDFIQKPFRDQELVDRVNAALRHDAENRAAEERHSDLKRRFDMLTAREREVMELIVDGRPNKVVAIELHLSERTVEIHRANVMTKMGARSLAHLVKLHLTLSGGTDGS
jgi:FixJ family two-component response regulator